MQSNLNTEFSTDTWGIHWDDNKERCHLNYHDYWGNITKAQKYIDFCQSSSWNISVENTLIMVALTLS